MARRTTTTREPAAAVVLMLLLAAATAAAAEEEALPMEAYFSAAELARIAGYGEEPVSSVSVSGQLTCELCLRPGSPLLALEMPGAKVAVTCDCESHQHPSDEPDSHALLAATTDESGNFTIDLPARLHATPDLEKACAVKVLRLPAGSSSCRLRHRAADAYRLRLASAEDGARAYTAGVIRLRDGDTPSDRCVPALVRAEDHVSGRR